MLFFWHTCARTAIAHKTAVFWHTCARTAIAHKTAVFRHTYARACFFFGALILPTSCLPCFYLAMSGPSKRSQTMKNNQFHSKSRIRKLSTETGSKLEQHATAFNNFTTYFFTHRSTHFPSNTTQ